MIARDKVRISKLFVMEKSACCTDQSKSNWRLPISKSHIASLTSWQPHGNTFHLTPTTNIMNQQVFRRLGLLQLQLRSHPISEGK